MGSVPEKSKGNNSKNVLLTYQQTWSGPLPPPKILSDFEAVVPGSAKQIMDAFQNQSAHRIEIEKIVITHNGEKEKRGQVYGLIIAIIGLLGGVTCILLGHDKAGSIIGGTPLACLVGVFVIGKVKQVKSLAKKDNIKPAK